jgi:hypothetical protein
VRRLLGTTPWFFIIPWFLIIRGVDCVGFWVLTVFGQVGGESEARGNKRKKQNASLPLLYVQGKKKKKNNVV